MAMNAEHVIICSPSTAMLTSHYEWKFSSGTINPKQTNTLIGPETAKQLANPYWPAQPRNTGPNLNHQIRYIKEMQKLYYDKSNNVNHWWTSQSCSPENSKAKVVETLKQSKSYTMEINNNWRLRRNRKYLRRTDTDAIPLARTRKRTRYKNWFLVLYL